MPVSWISLLNQMQLISQVHTVTHVQFPALQLLSVVLVHAYATELHPGCSSMPMPTSGLGSYTYFNTIINILTYCV